MNLSTVTIHEFSTGIQAERTPDGGWVSRGFTGQYINKTLDPIPVAIQSAIANREFAVAEGASSNDPAIIGREVRGGGQDWSAIAVVTRGRDDRGRSASMYRYFFCEGLGNLWKILAWIESERKAGRMPIFNPFETKIVGQPNKYQADNEPVIPLKNELQYLLTNEALIIIPSEQPCTAFIVNFMATEKARQIGQPVAWAYKAEALEQPRSFQVIQPASAKAEQLLQKAIASTPQYTAPIAGEQEVKSAIKGLISRDKVKLESVQIIGAAINQIKDSDWEVIFNGQGASQALRQGIYSPQMVRLLTLRAMVIPQTLPEFVDWIQKRGKQEDYKQISEDFQLEISNSSREIPENTQNLLLKVTQGVKLIIPKLFDQPELLGGVVWLLSSPSGLWKEIYSQQVAVDINHDFKLMSDKVMGVTNVQFKVIADHEWEELSSQLQIYWQDSSYPYQEKYQPLADLFGKLRNPRIAAFFYHVAYGEVPKNIFRKISNRGGFSSTVYGVTIKRQVPLTEILGVLIQEFFAIKIPIGEKYMPLWVALLILLIFTGLGGGVGWIFRSIQPDVKTGAAQSSQTPTPAASTSPSTSPLASPTTSASKPSSKSPSSPDNKDMNDLINKALQDQNFNTTRNAIMEIVNKCKKGDQNNLFDEIKNILNTYENSSKKKNLQLKVIREASSTYPEKTQHQKEWVEAIISYQQNHQENGSADGIIGSKTAQTLENDLKKSPKIQCENLK